MMRVALIAIMALSLAACDDRPDGRGWEQLPMSGTVKVKKAKISRQKIRADIDTPAGIEIGCRKSECEFITIRVKGRYQ